MRLINHSELKLGKNCNIEESVKFYAESPEDLLFGDYVQINAYCVFTGKIEFRGMNYIGSHNVCYGKHGVIFEECTGLAMHSSIMTEVDDFCFGFLKGGFVPMEFRFAKTGLVKLEKFSAVANYCMIFPGITLAEGSCLTPYTCLKESTEPYGVYLGNPGKKMHNLDKNLMNSMYLKYVDYLTKGGS